MKPLKNKPPRTCKYFELKEEYNHPGKSAKRCAFDAKPSKKGTKSRAGHYRKQDTYSAINTEVLAKEAKLEAEKKQNLEQGTQRWATAERIE